MKDIKVLGPGCAKCAELAEEVQKIADEIGFEYKFEKITDITKILEYGVMVTPALIIDGETKVAGKVPTKDELHEILR